MYSCELNNKVMIPCIGLGLWQVTDRQECINAIKTALQLGYRHFDSAQFYGNEAWVSEAVGQSDVDRKDVFITTKISNGNQHGHRTTESFEESLQKMGEDYVDLLLLHYPVTETRAEAWRELEAIYANKQARAIGVSNYTIRHLKELLKTCTIKPAVNQVELHVYLQQPELLTFCAEHDIKVEAYSPLAHGHGIENPTLAEVANKHGATPAQIMIAWCLNVGAVALPKSVHAERLKENLEAFDIKLDQDDMAALAKLDKNMRTAWDPTETP